MIRSRIKAVGKRTKRWDAHINRTRVQVCERAGGWCEAPKCDRPGTDLAHGFGRGHIVGEPLASHPLMCFWLCRECHQQMDHWSPKFQREMRQVAAWRTAEAILTPVEAGMVAHLYDEPVGMVRMIERILRTNADG